MSHRSLYLLAGALGLLVLAIAPLSLVLFTSQPGSSAGSPINAPIQLAWFYRPPEDGSPMQEVAANFDDFILTHYDETYRDNLREEGKSGPFLLYLRFEVIQNPALCLDPRYCSDEGIPWGNQVAYKLGDFDTISREHPDWFLRDADGELIIFDDSFVMMDPGNAGWREFFLERAVEMQELYGWDGVFLDNVEASGDKIRRLGHSGLADYPDDRSYQAEVEAFLDYLYNGYFSPEGRPMYANIIEVREPATWFSYLRYLDGAMDEAWGVGWPDEYFQPADWLARLERAEQSQLQGKHVVLVSQGERTDLDRQRFAFASYLLINNGNASFRYANYDGYYEQVWLYDTYNLPIGLPTGQRECVFDALCWRRFENGWVLVFPGRHQAVISAR